MPAALIVDSDLDGVLPLTDVFRAEGFRVETAADLASARQFLSRRKPDVALLGEFIDGEPVLDLLDDLGVGGVVDVYLVSEDGSLESCTRALRLGITDYFTKPVDRERLARNLRDIASADGHVEEGQGKLIGASLQMQRLYRLIRKSAPSEASILITGESGTGKELVAETIHELSPRSDQNLVALNCAAVPVELMESELFGHEKGSFTGATRDHRGFFQRARGGTLFLDEITEMSASLQAKLLRVLESGRVRPVGSEEEISVDVRIVAATNIDPEEAIDRNQLREDLYYRLAQFPLRVPTLRERGEDIERLARYFLDRQNRTDGVSKRFSDEALEALRLHDWPGNVRELKNAVIHGHLLATDVIGPADLPEHVPGSAGGGGPFVRISVGMPLDEVERRHLLSTLNHYDGDKKRTAEALGVSLKTVYNRLKKYRKPDD